MTIDQDDPPMVVFVVSNPLSPEVNKNEPIPWQVGQPHPLIPGMRIRGIFVVDDAVEIYAEGVGDKCTRSTIPMHGIRYVQETMSREVYEEEYEDAQLAVDEQYSPSPEPGGPDDPDDEPGDPGGRETAPPPGPNGQTSP